MGSTLLTLDQLQLEHREWCDHNFPDAPPYQFLLGAIEELGELAHAQLKGESGIREGVNPEGIYVAKADAVADLFIYLAGYCNSQGISMAVALHETWDKVKQRDWVAYPDTGRPPDEPEGDMRSRLHTCSSGITKHKPHWWVEQPSGEARLCPGVEGYPTE